MARRDPLLDYLVDHLSLLGAAQGRSMFGGFGVYLDGLIVGLIAFDTFYLKADDTNRADFETAGAEPFRYGRSGKTATINAYWTCPADVLEDPELLRAWTAKSLTVSRRAAASARKPKRKAVRKSSKKKTANRKR
jgi:DNA transformation protein